MLVMGILNVTPDSFADGERHNEFEAAVARGMEFSGAHNVRRLRCREQLLTLHVRYQR